MTDRSGNDRYDKLLMQTVEKIQTEVTAGRKEQHEFRVESTAKLAALDVKVETLGAHLSEDARKNRKYAAIAGGISGAATAVLAAFGVHVKS